MRRETKSHVVVVLALLSGCATVEAPLRLHLEAPSARVRDCGEWYAALDAAVEEAGVRDAQYARVSGFPYLRVDRSLAALRGRAAQGAAAYATYVERLAELDLEARTHEILNLPRERLDRLPGVSQAVSRTLLVQRTRDCGRLLRELDFARPQSRALVLERAAVPDDYSMLARTVGLYPLTRLPFAAGVRRWEEDTRAAFQREPDASLPIVRYAPPPPTRPMGRRSAAALLERARFDPLGQMQLSQRELFDLAAVYAPSFEIPVAADYDRFGRMRWRRGAAMPEVDAAEPAVYVQPAYAHYGETILLQLVYTLWFPERPASGAVDLLAGRLDGITWRVTLAPDGEPLLYDSIHPCGCFHMFFPTPRAKPRPAPVALEEWAFVPHSLPRVKEGERPVLRLASATHYIERVDFVRGADSLARYVFHPYDELRSLPRPTGESRSLFGPDGLVPGTERLERWIFWPMGVPSAGTMRQWGRHATAFVGRRHFDDADLIARRFEIDFGAQP